MPTKPISAWPAIALPGARRRSITTPALPSSTIDKRLRSDPLALGFNPIRRIYGSSCNNNYYFH